MKARPFWNPEDSENLFTCETCRFDVLFPKAIIETLGNLEIVTYVLAWSLARGRPKKCLMVEINVNSQHFVSHALPPNSFSRE